MAVLLDKFITATVDMEAEERQLEIEEIKKKEEVLAPFLADRLAWLDRMICFDTDDEYFVVWWARFQSNRSPSIFISI